MTRTLRWFIFLVACDLAVSTVLLAYAPDKTHSAMTCFSEALAR